MPRGKIYIGCALTDVPAEHKERFKADIARLKGILRADDYEILEFFGLSGGYGKESCHEVVAKDLGNVFECDLFVAVCEFPSIGLGIELGFAAEKGKPRIIAMPFGKKVTRMAKGLDFVESNQTYYEYDDICRLRLPINLFFLKRNMRCMQPVGSSS